VACFRGVGLDLVFLWGFRVLGLLWVWKLASSHLRKGFNGAGQALLRVKSFYWVGTD
jgi:hypothetical protein